jgi:hypothetical protein
LADLLESNIFDKGANYSNAKDVFKYFEKIPKKFLKKYDIYRDPNGNDVGVSPLSFFEEVFQK